jgi:hypothetical protein
MPSVNEKMAERRPSDAGLVPALPAGRLRANGRDRCHTGTLRDDLPRTG